MPPTHHRDEFFSIEQDKPLLPMRFTLLQDNAVAFGPQMVKKELTTLQNAIIVVVLNEFYECV